MRLLRIKLFQETACYVKPFAFKVGESYPLAPYSTVKGMLHSVVDASSYMPMDISIQGSYESVMIDYVKKYMFKKKEAMSPLTDAGLPFLFEEGNITSMPMYTHLLFNVEHVLHVKAETSTLELLHEKLQQPERILSLGRWEDTVRLDEVTYVEAQQEDMMEEFPYDCYIPFDPAEKSYALGPRSISYRMPRRYEVREGKRVWDYVHVAHEEEGASFEDELLSDGEYPVFLIKGD